MKATVLLENATPSSRLIARHGLSLMLDLASGTRILFDMGPDDSFLRNAKALGIDVATVDAAVVSHGHMDHGGGLGAFLKETESAAHPAPVYIRQGAFAPHRSGTPQQHRNISLDASLAAHPRVTMTSGQREIVPGALLFANVPRHHPEPASNARLFEVRDGLLVPDGFLHEQNLLITEDGRHALISGCSHAGILNIIECAEELTGGPLDAVVAGSHLMSPSAGTVEDAEGVRQLARELAGRPTRYYTFHCTGMESFGILRDVLGERVRYLSTGSVVELYQGALFVPAV